MHDTWCPYIDWGRGATRAAPVILRDMPVSPSPPSIPSDRKRRKAAAIAAALLAALASCRAPVLMVQPKAPTCMLAAPSSQNSISIDWTDTNSGKASYRVERGVGANANFSPVATTAAGATSYTDTGLSAGTAYYYRAAAVLGLQISAYGPVVSATTLSVPQPAASLPASPGDVVATATGPNSVTITWTDPAKDQTGFIVTRITSQSGGIPINLTPNSPLSASTETFSDSNLTPVTEYGYTVYAVNAAGTSNPSSLAWVTTSSLISVPAPSGVLASQGVFGSVIFVDWPADTGATTYKLYQSYNAGGAFAPWATGISTLYNWVYGGLSNPPQYFEISGVDSSGDETAQSAPAEGWAGTMFFNEGFEAPRLQGYWVAGSPAPQVSLVNPGANKTAACLQMAHQSGSGNGFAGLAADLHQSVQPSSVGFWFDIVSPASAYDAAFFVVSSSSGAQPIFVDITRSLHIAPANAQDTPVGDATYLVGQWYHVQLANISFSSHTYDFYVDGVLKAQNVTFDPSAADMRMVSLSVYDSKAVIEWDEITVQ